MIGFDKDELSKQPLEIYINECKYYYFIKLDKTHSYHYMYEDNCKEGLDDYCKEMNLNDFGNYLLK